MGDHAVAYRFKVTGPRRSSVIEMLPYQDGLVVNIIWIDCSLRVSQIQIFAARKLAFFLGRDLVFLLFFLAKIVFYFFFFLVKNVFFFVFSWSKACFLSFINCPPL